MWLLRLVLPLLIIIGHLWRHLMLMERQRVSIKCNKYWVNQAIQTGEGGLTYLWIELNVDKWDMRQWKFTWLGGGTT